MDWAYVTSGVQDIYTYYLEKGECNYIPRAGSTASLEIQALHLVIGDLC